MVIWAAASKGILIVLAHEAQFAIARVIELDLAYGSERVYPHAILRDGAVLANFVALCL